MATCPVCQARGPIRLDGPRETEVGTVAVLLEQTPVVRCPPDHGVAPPEVVDAAMQATEGSVPQARRRLLRSDVCSRCGAELSMPVRRTTRAVTVEPPGGPVVTLRFDLPMTRCPNCGLDQLPSRSQEDLVVSVPAVFSAV